MRTIVINTSKDAEGTNLNILFKTPFDSSRLLWFYKELNELSDAASEIKQSLITNADKVDRDYNLIVLVDLYNFEFGNEKDAVAIYKALITKYVGATLIGRLSAEFSLLPNQASIYYMDSATQVNGFDFQTAFSDANPTEQKNKKEKKNSKATKKPVSLTNDQKLIMRVFGWKEELSVKDLKWVIKSTNTEGKQLDLEEVFKISRISLANSPDTDNLLPGALKDVEDSISGASLSDWQSDSLSTVVPEISNKSYEIASLTCRFERDNEQLFTESLFNLFANVFSCVQTAAISRHIKKYGTKEIEKIFISALKKYNHFSLEKNMDVKFEYIVKLFESRDKILEARKKRYKGAKSTGKTFEFENPDQLMEAIRAEVKVPSGNNQAREAASAMIGANKKFHLMVADIFDNYDEQLIGAQNEWLVKQLLGGLWTWRDSETNESFSQIANEVLAKEKAENESEADITLIPDNCEKEYFEVLTDITEAEYKIAANKDILLDTKNLMIKYADLMRKGKLWLISTVGAAIAVIASVLPYIAIQSSSINENIIHRILYIAFTAGFVFLYCVASSIYISRINSKKAALIEELSALKEQSEESRKESLMSLHTYYTKTIEKAENLYLLRRELERRKRENAKKNVKLNSHKKRLKEMAGLVERFITSLKIDINTVSETDNDDTESYSDYTLKVCEPFYSPDNYKVYSILPIDEANYTEGEKQ